MARALDNLAGTPALAAYTASLIADGWDSEASLRAMDDYEKCLVSREGGGGGWLWCLEHHKYSFVICGVFYLSVWAVRAWRGTLCIPGDARPCSRPPGAADQRNTEAAGSSPTDTALATW